MDLEALCLRLIEALGLRLLAAPCPQLFPIPPCRRPKASGHRPCRPVFCGTRFSRAHRPPRVATAQGRYPTDFALVNVRRRWALGFFPRNVVPLRAHRGPGHRTTAGPRPLPRQRLASEASLVIHKSGNLGPRANTKGTVTFHPPARPADRTDRECTGRSSVGAGDEAWSAPVTNCTVKGVRADGIGRVGRHAERLGLSVGAPGGATLTTLLTPKARSVSSGFFVRAASVPSGFCDVKGRARVGLAASRSRLRVARGPLLVTRADALRARSLVTRSNGAAPPPLQAR
jgi:hypothetical protein